MADDIREARQMVIGAVLSYADACERDVQPSKIAMALKAVDDAFDALIAAVRAETEQQITALKHAVADAAAVQKDGPR